jgi:hypothetical protein
MSIEKDVDKFFKSGARLFRNVAKKAEKEVNHANKEVAQSYQQQLQQQQVQQQQQHNQPHKLPTEVKHKPAYSSGFDHAIAATWLDRILTSLVIYRLVIVLAVDVPMTFGWPLLEKDCYRCVYTICQGICEFRSTLMMDLTHYISVIDPLAASLPFATVIDMAFVTFLYSPLYVAIVVSLHKKKDIRILGYVFSALYLNMVVRYLIQSIYGKYIDTNVLWLTYLGKPASAKPLLVIACNTLELIIPVLVAIRCSINPLYPVSKSKAH